MLCSQRVRFIALISFLSLVLGCGSKNPAPTTPSGSSGPPTYSYSYFFGGGGTSDSVNAPIGLAIYGNLAWVGSASSLQAWTLAGSQSLKITTYNSTSISDSCWVAIGPDDYVYLADVFHSQVAELNPVGGYVTTFGKAQMGSDSATGVAVNSSMAYVSDVTGHFILSYDISGSGSSKTISYNATFGAATLNAPFGINLDGSGNVYVADNGLGTVAKFSPAGVYQSSVTLVSGGTPWTGVVDSAGYLYVTDQANHEIQMFNSSGSAVTQFGSEVLTAPAGIALDGANNLYVTDYATSDVVVFKRN